MCSAEPLSEAKRAKLERAGGRAVRDTFGMTEAGMMGAEDADGPGQGFRIWTDLYAIEVVDPDSHRAGGRRRGRRARRHAALDEQRHAVRALALGRPRDAHSRRRRPQRAVLGVSARPPHAHRTSGFFKIRGVNIGHADFEDFVFQNVRTSTTSRRRP